MAPEVVQHVSGRMGPAPFHPYPPASMVAVPRSRSAPRRDWRYWMALGACFGLGHGIADRLIRAQGDGGGPAGHQNFGVQAFPGETLEALRRRHGDAPRDVFVDFAALEQEKRNQQDQADADKDRSELEDRQRAEARLAQQEAERARLDALDGASPSIPAPGPAPGGSTSLESLPQPAAPDLEVPAPSRGSNPEPAAGPGLQLPALPEAPPAPIPAAQP